LIDYIFTQACYKTAQIIATEDEQDSQAPGARIAALQNVIHWFNGTRHGEITEVG